MKYEVNKSNRVNPPEAKKYQNAPKWDGLTILGNGEQDIKKYIIPLRLFLPSRLPIRILSGRNFRPDAVACFRRWNIELIVCSTQDAVFGKLAESRFVIIPQTHSGDPDGAQDDDQWVVFAAMSGAIVFGGTMTDGMHRCYPEITSTPLRICMRNHSPQKANSIGGSRKKSGYFSQLWGIILHCGYAAIWYRRLKDNPAKIEYLAGYAQVKAEYYYGKYSTGRFFGPLSCDTNVSSQIVHVHGPETINYHREEFVVVCLVKNGVEYIRTFMEHYHRLGARHFFFIDNGSTDDTVALLKQYPNLTIYQTGLPHKKYECEIRRTVIEKHCQNNWCLCADIDELFDYPYSHQVSMDYFLRYLNTHHYTAVLSYLLDMFAIEHEFIAKKVEPDMVAQYCYYDLSYIHKSPYHQSFFAYTRDNRLADPHMKSYSGGIRRKVFQNKKSSYLLTKHPLLFIDSKIEPVVHPHFCNKAYIADVNGVLKHYKLISSFKNRVISSLESEDYSYYGEQEHKQYLKTINDKDQLRLYSRKSKELKSVDQLTHEGFLRVSTIYRTYVKSIASLTRHPDG